jgi:CRP-like cAMP-binding protein
VNDVEQLGGIGLFGGLDDDTLAELADKLDRRSPRAGEVVYREGERGCELFVILEGEIAMEREGERLAVEGPGSWFGEMSVLDMQPRPVTATCATDAELLVMKSRDLDRLYRANPKKYALFMMNMARQLSRKLRKIL